MTDEPFDKFTMLPRNKREFAEAMSHQSRILADKGAGCLITAEYIRNATGLTDPLKCIALIYKHFPPTMFKVWYDGRIEGYLVESFNRPANVTSSPILQHEGPKLILNGHS